MTTSVVLCLIIKLFQETGQTWGKEQNKN